MGQVKNVYLFGNKINGMYLKRNTFLPLCNNQTDSSGWVVSSIFNQNKTFSSNRSNQLEKKNWSNIAHLSESFFSKTIKTMKVDNLTNGPFANSWLLIYDIFHWFIDIWSVINVDGSSQFPKNISTSLCLSQMTFKGFLTPFPSIGPKNSFSITRT